jgi:MFS family permease
MSDNAHDSTQRSADGSPGGPAAAAPTSAPKRTGLVLASLILVAAVANLNLTVANVDLPDIGKHFDSGQTMLDLIAVGYSLGFACSVLWLGALDDRYGSKLMAVGGTILAKASARSTPT